MPIPQDQLFAGSVQSYSEQKAWGFLVSPSLEQFVGAGKGIFFHLKDVIGGFQTPPASGFPVAFTVTTDNNGKLHAKNVQPHFEGAGVEAQTQGQQGWQGGPEISQFAPGSAMNAQVPKAGSQASYDEMGVSEVLHRRGSVRDGAKR